MPYNCMASPFFANYVPLGRLGHAIHRKRGWINDAKIHITSSTWYLQIVTAGNNQLHHSMVTPWPALSYYKKHFQMSNSIS